MSTTQEPTGRKQGYEGGRRRSSDKTFVGDSFFAPGVSQKTTGVEDKGV